MQCLFDEMTYILLYSHISSYRYTAFHTCDRVGDINNWGIYTRCNAFVLLSIDRFLSRIGLLGFSKELGKACIWIFTRMAYTYLHLVMMMGATEDRERRSLTLQHLVTVIQGNDCAIYAPFYFYFLWPHLVQ